MKRTTLRTSAIALGVAAALPATAQEWNLAWGGFIHQHVAFGSTDVKTLTTIPEITLKDTEYTSATGKLEIYRLSGGERVANVDPVSVTLKALDERPENFNLYDSEEDSRYFVGSISDLVTALSAAAGTEGAIHTAYINDYDDTKIMFEDDETAETYAQRVLAGLHVDDIVDSETQDISKLTIEFLYNLPDPEEGEVATTANQAFLHNDPSKVQEGDVEEAIAKYDGSGMHSNTEVHFKPSITLENGLTFGATIEFEGDQEAVDQSFISISSESLGTLKLGKHGKTGLGVHAPSVGIGINSGDHVNFIAVDPEGGAMSGTNSSIIGTADRVSYTTPKNSLGGFEFGISYAPGGDNAKDDIKDISGNSRRSGFLTKKKTGMSDNVDVAFKFEQPFGDANFALGMRYGTAKEEGATKNPRNFGIGASVGFGGFTFGGSYADVERATLAKSSSGWNLGASYAMGAWTFGIETYQGEADDGDEHSVSKIAASRKLGPGVDWDLYAITASSKNTISSSERKDASGNAFGTAIKLTF